MGWIERGRKLAVPGGVSLLVCGALLGVFAPAANEYFFLSDDYRLIGQGLSLSPWELASQPHFLYFRPTIHLWFMLEAYLFGWSAPSAYAFIGLALHLSNAVLIGALLRRVGAPAERCWVASGLFVVAPWSLEASFWVACRFDLMALFGSLCVAHLLVAKGSGRALSRGEKVRLLAIALLACGSKETACVLVVLMGLWHRRTFGRHAAQWACWSAVGVYMLCRWGAMALFVGPDPLMGHGGSLVDQLLHPGILQNAWAHLLSVFAPAELPGHPWLTLAYGLCTAMALLYGAAFHRRSTARLLCAAGLVLLPALGIERPVDGVGGGRLLYIPGAFLAVLLSAPFADGASATSPYRVVRVGMLGVWLACAVNSGHHQSSLWRAAYASAHTSIVRFQSAHKGTGPIHIANMPYMMREGPQLLKPYAYEWFGNHGRVGSVSATPVIHQFIDGHAVPITTWGRPHVESPAGSQVLRL